MGSKSIDGVGGLSLVWGERVPTSTLFYKKLWVGPKSFMKNAPAFPSAFVLLAHFRLSIVVELLFSTCKESANKKKYFADVNTF